MSLNIGIIGLGAIGNAHADRIEEKLVGGRVVAVADAQQASAKAYANRVGHPVTVHESGEALCQNPNVQAVIVSSWGDSHAQYVVAALKAGKPVFCEKPLASTADACLEIVNAEAALGRKLVQVGFMRRYDQTYRLLKNELGQGTAGTPLLVHCAHRNAATPGDSFTGDMPLTDSLSHEIDVLRWLLKEDFVSAQVRTGRKSGLAPERLTDPHMVYLETTSGVQIDVELFMNCQYGYDIQCSIVGETGIINLPEPMSVLHRQKGLLSQDILQDWKLRFEAAYDAEIQAWIDDTVAGRMTGPTAWDGYMVAVTTDACVASKRAGEIVPIRSVDRPSLYDA